MKQISNNCVCLRAAQQQVALVIRLLQHVDTVSAGDSVLLAQAAAESAAEWLELFAEDEL